MPAALLDRPFTRADARAAGISDSALQSRPWRSVLRGVWVHEDTADTRELRLAAAKLVIPSRGVLRGLTAAWIYGADVRRQDDVDVHVGFPPGGRTRGRPGVVVCQETLLPEDVWAIDGTAVTSPVRTAFDCLRLLRGFDGIIVSDALMHLQLTDVASLRRYFAQQRRLRNLRIGERLVDDVEPLAESPMESRLRLVIVRGGLPRPVAQLEVRNVGGAFVARVDLAYPALKIAIEYDGAWHWDRRRDDDRRRDALRALGWDVLVYSADDVFAHPERVVAEVASCRRSRERTITARPAS